jgi:hypothetical protein
MSNQEVIRYVRSQGWTGNLPLLSEVRQHWGRGRSLEEGYEAFKKERDAMARTAHAEFQASHSALSPRGAEAYTQGWN